MQRQTNSRSNLTFGRLVVFAVAALLCTPVLAESFNYRNFSSLDAFQTHFQALDLTQKIDSFIRLTPNESYPGSDPYLLDRGALWYTPRVTVTNGFTTSFQFRITPPTREGVAVGEGFAFVLQNQDLATIGDGAADLGYGRVAEAVAIEFDTHQNPFPWTTGPELAANHVSILASLEALRADNPLVSALSPVPFADGNTHVATITYTPPSRRNASARLSITIDRSGVLSADVPDLVTIFPSDMAIIGFTSGRSVDAGTPVLTADHDILSWEFRGTNRPPKR